MAMAYTNRSTTRTSLGRIAGVYLHNGDAQGGGFVLDELPQLVECPTVEVRPLCTAMLGPLTDAGQLLQDDNRLGIAAGEFDDVLANYVVCIALEAGFTARQVFQSAVCTFRPFGLKPTAHAPVVVLAMLNAPASAEDGSPIWCSGDGEVILAQVYTNDSLRIGGGENRPLGLEHDVQVEGTIPLGQGSRCSTPSEVLGLMCSADEGNFLSPGDGAKGDNALGGNKAKVTPPFTALQENATPEVEGGKPIAVVIRLHGSVSGGDLTFSRDGDLGGKTKAAAQVVIDCPVQAHVIGAVAHLMSNAACVVEGVAVGLHGTVKYVNLRRGRIQFETSSSANVHYEIGIPQL